MEKGENSVMYIVNMAIYLWKEDKWNEHFSLRKSHPNIYAQT